MLTECFLAEVDCHNEAAAGVPMRVCEDVVGL